MTHSMPSGRSEDRISQVLLILFLFDLTLVLWVFLAPELWFWAFHGAPYVDPQALLRRCGANWAGFATVQCIAWRRWRHQPVWLAVMAGVRWSDVYTDITCAMMADSVTWFGWATLPAMGCINFALGLYFFRQYQELTRQTAVTAQ